MKSLSINIDHVATLLRVRLSSHSFSLEQACDCVISSGAASITIHPRLDFRHIKESDVFRLIEYCRDSGYALNIEISIDHTDLLSDILKKAYDGLSICFVFERIGEETTESGINILSKDVSLSLEKSIEICSKVDFTQYTLFIDPCIKNIQSALKYDPHCIEINVDELSKSKEEKRSKICKEIDDISYYLSKQGVYVDLGHGIDYGVMMLVKDMINIRRLSVGYFVVCKSVFLGLSSAINRSIHFLS